MILFNLLVGLILIVSVLTILIVLVQNPKGGGLSSTFGGSNQYFGVRKTADFLEKATWTLAALLLVFVLISSKAIPKHKASASGAQSEIIEEIEKMPVKATVPFEPSETQTNENQPQEGQ